MSYWSGLGSVAVISTLIVGLAACKVEATRTPTQTTLDASSNKDTFVVGGNEIPCIKYDEINIRTPYDELPYGYRKKFLTAEAINAGVRVWVSSTEVTDYGNTVVRYTDPNDTCILWAESLSLQEYSSRIGLNPLPVALGYMPTTEEK